MHVIKGRKDAVKAASDKKTEKYLDAFAQAMQEYDGERRQSKDYFFTMQAVNEHGIDNPIGEKATEFLLGYMNHTLFLFAIEYMSFVEKLYVQSGGESFAEHFGLTTYRRGISPETGHEVYVGSDGSVRRAKQRKPRHLRMV